MRADTVIRRYKTRKQERAAALVMVILAIVVLTVFLTDVQQQSAASLSSAVAARDRLRAEYHARSAVNLSRLLLAAEPAVRRTVAPLFAMLAKGAKLPQIPVWEFSDQVLGAYNCADFAEGFSSLTGTDATTGVNLGLGDGKGCFELVIVDEDSKVNVNTAARGDIISRTRLASQLMSLMGGAQYNPLFESPDPDNQNSDRYAICGALIDWADSDEEAEACEVGSSSSPPSKGVEDNYYQTIGLRYFRKNAAFDSLDELRLVRGVGDDFWATFVDPEPENPRKRVMTVWGQGTVNVNTANAQTLLAIVCAGAPDAALCLDPIQAATFIQIVTLAKSFTAGAPLFSSGKDFVATMKGGGMIGPQLVAMGIEPVVFKSEAETAKMVSTRSKMFSIYAEGVVPGYKRETRVSIHAVVDMSAAPDITQLAAAAGAGAGGQGAAAGATGKGGAGGQGAGGSGSGDDVGAPPDPAGVLVYWRVE
jgi:general secretion pathway protein K